jgi:hypothetical protein
MLAPRPHLRKVLLTQSAPALEEGAAACVRTAQLCHGCVISASPPPPRSVGLLNSVVLGILARTAQAPQRPHPRTTRAPSTLATLSPSPVSPSLDLTPPNSRLLSHGPCFDFVSPPHSHSRLLEYGPCFVSVSLAHSSQSILRYL